MLNVTDISLLIFDSLLFALVFILQHQRSDKFICVAPRPIGTKWSDQFQSNLTKQKQVLEPLCT